MSNSSIECVQPTLKWNVLQTNSFPHLRSSSTSLQRSFLLFYTGHILIQMHLDASVCAIPFLMSNEKKFAFYSVSSFMFPIILTIYCQVYLSVFHQTFSFFFSFPRFYYCSFSLPHFASKMSLVFLLTIWGPNLLSVHRSHRVVFG